MSISATHTHVNYIDRRCKQRQKPFPGINLTALHYQKFNKAFFIVKITHFIEIIDF